MRTAIGILLLCLVATSVAFQLNEIFNPFTGTFFPNPYEYFDGGLPFLLKDPQALWGGHCVATATDNIPAYALCSPQPWNNVCSLAPRFGTTVFITLGRVTLTWDQPLYAFGGYFGANHNGIGPMGNDILFEFYDGSDNFLASAQTTIPNNCTWMWRSWGFSDKIVRKVVMTGSEGNGLIVTDQIRVSTTDVYIPGGTSGTTGTTGTTQFPTGAPPTCPGITNSLTVKNKGTQYRVDNEQEGDESIEGRFDLRSTDIFQAWFTRVHYTAPNRYETTRFKQRIRSVIEFLDNGSPVEDGYKPNNDTLIKETNLVNLNMVFQNWQTAGNTFTGVLPSSVEPIFVFHGKVRPETSPCAGAPLTPNVASIDLDLDWTQQYTVPDSKIALRVRYTMFGDALNITSGVESTILYPGDQSAPLFAEFVSRGHPSGVNSELGNVEILNRVVSTGDSTQPEFDVFYTFNTIEHTLHFTGFQLVQTKPFP